MKQLKIAVWHNLPSGGGKRAMYDQVRGLTRLGHYVEAWCPPTANQTFLPLNTLIKEHIVSLENPPSMSQSWLGRRQHRAWETGRRMKAMEDHCRRCAEDISTGGFDLLLAHPCVLFRASPIANYVYLPNVLYLAEPYRELYEAWPQLPWVAPQREYRPFSRSYWNGLIWELLKLNNKRVQVRNELAWVKSFDQILVNSLFSRESVLRAYNVDSRVCYLGIDTENLRPTGAAKESFVIGLGNIAFNKRVSLAVEAMGAIPADRRPRLIWVGNWADQGYLACIKKKAKELGVEFVEKVLVPDEDLRGLLSRAAVMIYTSHLEPFGFAPLEANACGTGVVALAEGGVRETVCHQDSGVLVSSSNPEEFADELMKFTGNLQFAAEFGRRSRAYVEQHWSQEKALKRLEAELQRVINNKHGRIKKEANSQL